MADLIIQNPSITPNVFEYDEAGRVSAISGYPLAGGGGGTIVKSDLMWKPSVESDGFVHWTLASSATTPAPAYISGAQGPAGSQGVSGNPGKNPEFQINSENAHWEWRYSGDAGWTDLGVVASGAVGPQGLSGNDGEDGISPKVRINNSTNFWEISEDDGKTWTSTNVSATGPAGEDGTDGTNGVSPTVSTSAIPGGNRVIFTYDNGETTATESIDVMSGASGAPGANGVSPTVTITDAPTATQHPQGGKTVTITDADNPTGQSFDIWNGINGEGATVNLLDGNGIHITNDGTNYTIAVSADYATKSYVDSASANALSESKTWVGEQGYLTSIPNTYALKTDVEAASANAYDKAVAQIPDVTNFITKDVNNLTYYYEKTETSAANELATEFAKYVSTGDILTAANNTLTGIKIGSTSYAVPTTDLSNYYTKSETSATGELNTEFAKKLDSTIAASTYQTIVGMSNYLTTTEASQTYLDKTIYATDSATFVTSSNSTITGTKQYALTTTGWTSVETAYLPTSGGTVSGETVLSGTQGNFDNSYLKCINNDSAYYARFGLGRYGGAVIKAGTVGNNPVQLNIKPSNNNNELVELQNNGSTVGFLIPAVTATTTTGLTDDGILHIIVEN